MKITTNYSRSDWKRAVPAMIIYCIPIMLLFFTTFYLYIPYIEAFAYYLDFLTVDQNIVKFIEYLDANNIQNEYLDTLDGFVLFIFLFWFGGAIFPILIIVRFIYIIPTQAIVRRLGFESRMKLVVFVNGKPITRIRDLFRK